MFRSCKNEGFQLTLPNGWVLSTQFGEYNYCRDYPFNKPFDNPSWPSSPDAEIAFWEGQHDMCEPLGYQTIEDFLKILDELRSDQAPYYFGA